MLDLRSVIDMKRNKKKDEVIINVDATDGHDIEEDEVEPEVVDKPKKKRKGFASLFQTFNIYKFIVKIIATILLLTFGIIILIYRDTTALFALYIITGGVTVFQALIRVIFLFKKSRNPRAKVVTGVELILEFLLGMFFILGALAQYAVNIETADNKQSQFIHDYVKFVNDYYPLFTAIIFYVGSMSYFWRTILLSDESDKFKFWMNFTLITGAVVLAAFRKDWNAIVIAIIIAVLALLSALVIGGEAVGGYILYRKETRPAKDKEKEEQKGIEAPARDDEKEYDDIDPNTIPKDEPTTDSDIIS